MSASPEAAAPGETLLPGISATLSSVMVGVPTRDMSSDSSSITKAVSNSEGSGPRAGAASSLGLGRLGFAEGESVLELNLLAVEADLETGAGVAAF